MTSRDFAFWLQGFFELSIEDGEINISKEQAKTISNHLNLVFKHEIDPSMPDPTGELQAIHDGKPFITKEELNNILQTPHYSPAGQQLLRC